MKHWVIFRLPQTAKVCSMKLVDNVVEIEKLIFDSKKAQPVINVKYGIIKQCREILDWNFGA